MKIVYRILILVFVFAGSLIYFGSRMPEVVYSNETSTTRMSEAALPGITLSVDSYEINRLYGYAVRMDPLLMRETITPLSAQPVFDVRITENENTIKRFEYELTDLDGRTVDSGTIHALERMENGDKSATVRLQAELETDTEYLLTMTLVNSQSRKYYYYTRVRVYNNTHLAEHLDFALSFHEAMFSKEDAVEYQRYMESKASSDTTTLARVDIYSSFDLLTWGELTPQVIKEPVPSVTEISSDIAQVVLEYPVQAETGTGLELYSVRECFRIRYTSNRMYLLNYERTMETIFNPEHFSLSGGEFKLGITSQTEVPYLVNDAGNMAAFVRNRELWYYNFAENTLVKVFSFRQDNTDFVRDSYDNHEVRLLNMDESGNIDFMVYGYMNRGDYEGRMAIVLYRYIRQEGRIEEQVYIPLAQPWQVLKEEVGDFCYRSSLDIFYFTLYDKLYSYNLTSRQLVVVCEDIGDGGLIYSADADYVAWEERNENGLAETIQVLKLETGEMSEIPAGEGEVIFLLGRIDSNLICGFAEASAITYTAYGTRIDPMYRIRILDPELTILKDYTPREGTFVTGASVNGNVLTLTLMRPEDGRYRDAGIDSILNMVTEVSEPISVTSRVTELTLTEYYLALPDSFIIEDTPKRSDTLNTVITQDTTVRVEEPETMPQRWYAYSFGEVIGSYPAAGEAVAAADGAVGVVISRNGTVVWERGKKGSSAQLTVPLISSDQSVEAAVSMIFAYQNVEADTSGLSLADGSIADAFDRYLRAQFLNLKGATLDQVLYYVYMNSPVIAFRDEDSAVLITGYDSQTVTWLDPETGRTVRVTLDDAEKQFSDAGNIYFSYRN